MSVKPQQQASSQCPMSSDCLHLVTWPVDYQAHAQVGHFPLTTPLAMAIIFKFKNHHISAMPT